MTRPNENISKAEYDYILSVDCGSDRTKVAVWDSISNVLKPFAINPPSLFYIDNSGHISFGEEALDLSFFDPFGTLSHIKLKLHKTIRAANGRKAEVTALLSRLFKYIFKKFNYEFNLIGKSVKKQIILTVPAEGAYEEIYTSAILEADDSFYGHILFVREPMAIVTRWKQTEKSNFEGRVVTIDVGARITDCTCLHLEENNFKILSNPHPVQIPYGSYELDKILLSMLDEAIKKKDLSEQKEIRKYLEQSHMLVMNFLKKTRERLTATQKRNIYLTLAGYDLEINTAVFVQTALDKMTAQVLRPTMSIISKLTDNEQVPVHCLLVGCGSKTHGLRAAFKSEIGRLSEETKCPVVLESFDPNEHVIALGAAGLSIRSLNYTEPDKEKPKVLVGPMIPATIQYFKPKE